MLCLTLIDYTHNRQVWSPPPPTYTRPFLLNYNQKKPRLDFSLPLPLLSTHTHTTQAEAATTTDTPTCFVPRCYY